MIGGYWGYEPIRIVPHPRTMRKARENLKSMVASRVSLSQTRNYLHRFVLWWVKTVDGWTYEELLELFIRSCWELSLAAIAEGLFRKVTGLDSGASNAPDLAILAVA